MPSLRQIAAKEPSLPMDRALLSLRRVLEFKWRWTGPLMIPIRLCGPSVSTKLQPWAPKTRHHRDLKGATSVADRLPSQGLIVHYPVIALLDARAKTARGALEDGGILLGHYR